MSRSKKNFDKTFEDENKATNALVDIGTIQLTAEDLYDKDKVDLEQVHLEDVWKLLQTTEEGLTEAEVQRRLEIFGPNKLESTEVNPLFLFLSFMWNPLSWVMEGAAIVAIGLSNGQGRPPDWQDFLGIVLLLFIVKRRYWILRRAIAGNAVKALMDSLAPKAKVRRAGQWSEIDSADLVPGDIVAFKIGDVVPSDCRLYDAINVSIDQAALTGESLPSTKHVGDQCFSGSTCKQGEAEGVVIATGPNTFFGRAATLVGADNDSTGHMQAVLAKIGTFCLVSIGIFVVLEIIILYGAFRYQYRRGIDNILVLLIGGIPIAMPTVLSVTLAVGAQQLAKYKAIVTRITAIEELAGVTILCSDKTGTLTTNKLTIDKSTVKTYADFGADEVCVLAAYASRTENQDAIDTCVVGNVGTEVARRGIQLLDFKPFNPVDKRTEITYIDTASGQMRRVTKGMTGVIIDLCTHNKTEALENRLENDVEEFARRGLRALAVAYEDVPNAQVDGPGSGFELIGLLSIFDPPRDDTKQTIDDAQLLGVKVKMVTGDQLAIAKETGRRLGMGDHMYPSKVLKDGPEPGGKFATLDEMILDADGFAGVFPEHKYEIVKRLQGLGHLCAMTGDGANDAPALARANVGIAVEGATDAAEVPLISSLLNPVSPPSFTPSVNPVSSSNVCETTRSTHVPSPSVLSQSPDHWDLTEIFTYAMGYGICLALSTIVLLAVIIHTSFFEDRFGTEALKNQNDPRVHMIIYLQVAIISQALIFVTRSHGWFFMERPSAALFGAFIIAQLISSIIAAYGNWKFTDVEGISATWIVIKMFKPPVANNKPIPANQLQRTPSRAASINESLYSNRASFIQRGANRNSVLRGRVHADERELRRFSSAQAVSSGAALNRA
ncbi:hypothetical protein PSTT_11775 [Puccinia striiformis]|uniref:Plasma membrane ATPase n=1 Tax=Puccinia striiformis TaxID=27350 RepID=A0A2S4UYZ2_9BASI|nr:hypothetical protein PSTT_11775 [Puccinia striiformis]